MSKIIFNSMAAILVATAMHSAMADDASTESYKGPESEISFQAKRNAAEKAAMLSADKMSRRYAEAARMPAPQRSLYTSQSEDVSKEMFRKNNTVFFGEIHDDVNFKFLADNPAFFREAASRGARFMFVELQVTDTPLFKAYFNGKITEEKFEYMLAHGNTLHQSGDTSASYAKQIVSLCKTAKDNNIEVLPSDFRGFARSATLTTDGFGIPDITGRNDAVRDQTLQSLAEFRREKGIDYPVTDDDVATFRFMHEKRIARLPEDQKQKFDVDSMKRQQELMKDKDPANRIYQDEAQFAYYRRLVKPGEKSMFMGGTQHFHSADGIDNLIEQNGYGAVTGVQLLSDSGLLYKDLMREFAKAATSPDISEITRTNLNANLQAAIIYDKYTYTFYTEEGDAFDIEGQKLSSVPQQSQNTLSVIGRVKCANG